jgi:hypothetical protein
MSIKVYVCRECGYAFPIELTNLIEQRIQVYCERCGSPFILEGVEFTPAHTPVKKKITPPSIAFSKSDSSNLNKVIQFLNKISFLPIFIFTVISFAFIFEIAFDFRNWDSVIFNHVLQGFIGLFLLIYDRAYIAPKVKEQKYNDIFIDSLCWGILACVLYGTGVIILIKGIVIFIYVITDEQNKSFRLYHYGLLAKNSFNYLSNKAGFVIILIGIFKAYADRIYVPMGTSDTITFPNSIEIPVIMFVYLGFLVLAIIALIIDGKQKSDIKSKNKFEVGDSIKLIIIGVMAAPFYASGVFIILKGVLIFFLFIGKPTNNFEIPSREIKPVIAPPRIEPPEPFLEAKKAEPYEDTPPVKPTPQEDVLAIEPRIKQPEKERIIEEIEEKSADEEREKKEDELDLRLHESLLPVKDEKDKKLVKEYFSKIFTLLSKDLIQEISNLEISKEERRELLEELAFLTKEEQIKYVEALADLYKEIPKKLIERIHKLPNIKPQHIDKLVEHLKYMDTQERVKFIQFLEENA